MSYITKDLTKGYNSYIDADVDDLGTLMDVGLLVLPKGESWTWTVPNDARSV